MKKNGSLRRNSHSTSTEDGKGKAGIREKMEREDRKSRAVHTLNRRYDW